MAQSVLPVRPPTAAGDLATLVQPAAVSAALVRAGLRPPRRTHLALEKAWPLPRIPLVLLYREPDAGGGTPVWWSLHALPEGRLPYAYRRALKAGNAVVVRELGALVQRFPEDLLLPALPGIVDEPGATLRQAGETVETPCVADVRSRIVGYKPARRCSLRLAGVEAGGGELFGKLLPPPVAREQWRLHAAIGRAFAAVAPPDVEVAAPDRFVPELGLLLWRPREGTSVFEMLDGAAAGRSAAAAGGALGCLHESPIAWTHTHGPQRELATLGLWVDAAARAFPAAASVLRPALQRVRAAAGAAPSGPLRQAHRDYYDKQVLLDGGRTVLLDFETACRAEPELDVANFLAHLTLRGLQRPRPLAGDLGGRFLSAYAQVAGRPDRRRLRWYRDGALLRLACVYAFRGGWGALSEALLAAAEEPSIEKRAELGGAGR